MESINSGSIVKLAEVPRPTQDACEIAIMRVVMRVSNYEKK